jgi:hypothetical protein
MVQRLSFFLALWLVSKAAAFGFRPISFRKPISLKAELSVGDAIIAEVDDILGSVSDPMVSFLVRS